MYAIPFDRVRVKFLGGNRFYVIGYLPVATPGAVK